MVEYFSFEDVLGELKLDEEELRRMVSEGELRAFRDENKMKFRKDDVDGLRKGKTTEPTIVLPSDAAFPATAPPTETEIGMGDLGPPPSETSVPALDVGATGVVPAPVQSEAGDTTGVTEEMVFDDSELAVSPTESGSVASAAEVETQETFVEGAPAVASDSGEVTQPLQSAEEASAEAPSAAATIEEVPGEAATAAVRGTRRHAVRTVAAAPPTYPILTATIGAAAAVLLMTGWMLFDITDVVMAGSNGGLTKPGVVPASVAGTVAGLFRFGEQEQGLKALMEEKSGEPSESAK